MSATLLIYSPNRTSLAKRITQHDLLPAPGKPEADFVGKVGGQSIPHVGKNIGAIIGKSGGKS